MGTRDLSSMSDLLVVLAKSGIQGPKDLKVLNLNERGLVIGSGSQFTVFKNHPSAGGLSGRGYLDLEGLVVKRAKVTSFREDGQDLAEGRNYRRHLRSLELEIVALCHPGIRNSRNIASLVAWGRDYIDPDTPVPALFMEAAKCSLDEFLHEETRWEIEHQIALDIASGLEVLHKHQIIHGDLKPGNILVFEQHDSKVPFIAKLSDFGLCIDFINSKSEISIDTYLGTPDWNAPELLNKDKFESLTRSMFEAAVLFKFDTYSYGLVLISIFCNKGAAPHLTARAESLAEAATAIIEDRRGLPPSLTSKLRSAARGLLDVNPFKRPPPTPDLLRTDDLISYRDWILSNAIPANSPRPGDTDPKFNQGPAFWTRLDRTILNDLLRNVFSHPTGKPPHIQPETLFGIALALSKQRGSAYADQAIACIERAAFLEYVPAQAICSQILQAHKKPLPPLSTLRDWERISLETGCFFTPGLGYLSPEEAAEARDLFREQGGHCKDGFTSISTILELASDPLKVAELISNQGPAIAVDLEGNSLAHAVAALGICQSLRVILSSFPDMVLAKNDNGETLLYKACQAGQMSILRSLRDFTVKSPSIATTREGITPLHWLFMFKDDDLHEACEYLAGSNNENINSRMVPETNSSSIYHHNHFPVLHYPFELPYGSPLHWAAASRNFAAMRVLLEKGSDIDAVCFNNHPHSTPLCLAVYYGDVEVTKFLLSHGANHQVIDSKNRTLLHRLSCYLPELHGTSPCQWHYWIRHGNWENHKCQMSGIVELLLHAGVNIEACSTDYPPMTPLLTAAESGKSDEGAIMAFIEAGADMDTVKGTCNDSVLISWSCLASPKLYYPDCYSEVMNAIVKNTKDVGYANDQLQTALHFTAAIDSSRDQFKSNVFALISKSPPPNINARNYRGETPLLLALMGNGDDDMFRASILLDYGANIYAVDNSGRNVFGIISGNRAFMDDDSEGYIRSLLLRVNKLPELAFKNFEHTSNSALWNASTFARPKTLRLLLEFGLSTHINDIMDQDGAKTALDMALDYGEASRQAHMGKISLYGNASSSNLIEGSYQLYDDKQGGLERAREAYWAFPATIEILRKYGAKRAWELGPQYDCENIEQPALFDLNDIYSDGFTSITQPNREHWSILYELAKYKPSWMEDQLNRLTPWYEDGMYRPHVEAVVNWPELCERLQEKSKDGWIKAISEENLMLDVKMENGKVVQRRIVEASGGY
ncbi:ankyrin [Stipitochalara longipes BDJ]|nr:ankyrin [Stipitochalara longipes BDJ]